MKILIIEDDANDVLQLSAVLRPIEVVDGVQAVTTGEAGFAYLAAAAELPAAIILDLKLPGMDGYEFLRRIKAEERWKEIPVIVVTATQDLKSVSEAYRMGATTFFLKPVAAEAGLLAAFLRRVAGQRPGKLQGTEAPLGFAPPEAQAGKGAAPGAP